MGYPTDKDFAEAHGWDPNRPSFSEADRLRDLRSKIEGSEERMANTSQENRAEKTSMSVMSIQIIRQFVGILRRAACSCANYCERVGDGEGQLFYRRIQKLAESMSGEVGE